MRAACCGSSRPPAPLQIAAAQAVRYAGQRRCDCPDGDTTVLIVEDDRDLRGLFADWLAFAGFRVQQTGDGVDALRILETDTPNAVVLDSCFPR